MSPQVVASLSELALDSPKRVEIGKHSVCLVRTVSGVRAISDVCSHADISLSEGEVDGETIECWLHGSRFDLVTGRPSGLPATQPIPVFPVTIEGDTVLIDAPADIPTH